MDEIKVTVVEFSDRKFYQMQYRDPVTGRKITRSTKVERTGRKSERVAAERVAAKWEDELQQGRYRPNTRATWEEFRERYELEKLSSLSTRTHQATCTAMNHFERIIGPKHLRSVTAEAMSRFQTELRRQGLAETSTATHLRHLKAALNWAVKMQLIREVPAVEMPRQARGRTMMRGRPITLEEFERMLKKVPEVRPRDSGLWIHYLRGLWLSGLRLEESLRVSWDQDDAFCIDLSGKHPRFRIYAEAHKGRRDQLLPMTPDFAEFILETPENEREGRLFKLNAVTTGRPIARRRVGLAIAEIGKKAAVVVSKEREKFGTAHDLRRAFGTRWAPKVKPATLQLLMRHRSIETTLKYYVQQDADDVAASLWTDHSTRARDSSVPEAVQQQPEKKRR